MWTEAQLAYMAGLIDGEGTISIFMSRHSTKGYSYPCYCPRVNVYNTNPLLMLWLLDTFGGKARLVKRGRNAWKPSYIWEISRKVAVPVIAAILPYLVIKREQAILFLRFRETIGKGGRGRSKLTPQKIAERQEIMTSIQTLNRRRHDAVVEFRRDKAYKESQVA